MGQWSREGFEWGKFWNLNLFYNALSCKIRKRCCITNTESVWWYNFNCELFSIDLCHSFNFSESNSISVLKTMSFLFMNRNNAFSFPCNAGNNSTFNFFACGVENVEIIPKINKGWAKKSTCMSPNKSVIFNSQSIVEVYEPLPIPDICNNNYVIFS